MPARFKHGIHASERFGFGRFFRFLDVAGLCVALTDRFKGNRVNDELSTSRIHSGETMIGATRFALLHASDKSLGGTAMPNADASRRISGTNKTAIGKATR